MMLSNKLKTQLEEKTVHLLLLLLKQSGLHWKILTKNSKKHIESKDYIIINEFLFNIFIKFSKKMFHVEHFCAII